MTTFFFSLSFSLAREHSARFLWPSKEKESKRHHIPISTKDGESSRGAKAGGCSAPRRRRNNSDDDDEIANAPDLDHRAPNVFQRFLLLSFASFLQQLDQSRC